jgi:hypothetical protein
MVFGLAGKMVRGPFLPLLHVLGRITSIPVSLHNEFRPTHPRFLRQNAGQLSAGSKSEYATFIDLDQGNIGMSVLEDTALEIH